MSTMRVHTNTMGWRAHLTSYLMFFVFYIALGPVFWGCEFDMSGKHRCRADEDCTALKVCAGVDEDANILGYCVVANGGTDSGQQSTDNDSLQSEVCTDDSDCPSDSESCRASRCRQRCETVTDCGKNPLETLCFNGFCIERCRTQSQCPANTTCSALPLTEDWMKINEQPATGCIFESVCWDDSYCFGALCGVGLVAGGPDGCLPEYCLNPDQCEGIEKCLIDTIVGMDTPYKNAAVGVCSDGSEGERCIDSLDCSGVLMCSGFPSVCTNYLNE